jgi:flagella basal body P-ring formation protein FlgA
MKKSTLFVSLAILSASMVPFHSVAIAKERADLLASEITALANKNTNSMLYAVEVLTPPDTLRKITCPTPVISFIGKTSNLKGRRTVVVECEKRRHFIQVKINAEGSWWVASRSLKAGETIQPQDTEMRSGSMSAQPHDSILSNENIIGHVLTRSINTGQSFQTSMLRKKWMVMSQQKVELEAVGDGFAIRSLGTAMSNASTGEQLRVRTQSGQIVTGEVIYEGKVKVISKE